MTDSQLSVPCVRCDAPASLGQAGTGEHHHPHKQMGGQGPKVAEHPTVPLCRQHHEQVHEGRFVLKVTGDFASTWEDGHCVSERALTVNDSHEDMRYWSSECLALAWGQVNTRAVDLLAFQCRVAFEFKRRNSWKKRWYDEAAEYMSEFVGYAVHNADVYRKAKLQEMFDGRWDQYERLGARVSLAVIGAADQEEALELATVAKENEYPSSDIVDIVKTRDRKRAYDPPPRHECPATCPECGAEVGCGATHRIKGG